MPDAVIRPARPGDLSGVLDLYRHLNPDDPVLSPEDAEASWKALLGSGLTTVLVAEVTGRSDLDAEIATGRPVVTDDPYALINSEQVDVLVDAVQREDLVTICKWESISIFLKQLSELKKQSVLIKP